MYRIINFTACILLVGIITFISCKKELSCEDCRDGNKPPIANAGADQTITLPKDSALLDGSASTDPDGTITSYKWAKVAGPVSADITKPDSAKTIIKTLIAGVYNFELTVTDNGGLSAKDTVQITVNVAVAYTCGDTNRPHINAQLIPIGTLSQKRNQFSVASAGNKILFAGGSGWSSRVDIYDIAANSWSTAELSTGRDYGIASVTNGDKVFFAGGQVSDGTFTTDAVDIYNASTNTWTATRLSLAGEFIAATAVGDKVIFAGGMGGFSGGFARAKRVDIYHLSTDTWTTAELSEYKTDGHNAVTVNNKVYIAGGHAGAWTNGYVSNRIDIYDNGTNTWSTATMPEGKTEHAGIVAGNNIYWAGGVTGTTFNTRSCSVDIINASTGSSTRQYLHSAGAWFITAGQNAVIRNNKIIFYSSVSAVNTFDIYDITTNTWSIGVLPITIDEASIISVNDIIYVAGGFVNGVLSDKVWKLEF